MVWLQSADPGTNPEALRHYVVSVTVRCVRTSAVRVVATTTMSGLKCPSEFADEPNALWQMRLIGPRMSAIEGYRLIAPEYNKVSATLGILCAQYHRSFKEDKQAYSASK